MRPLGWLSAMLAIIVLSAVPAAAQGTLAPGTLAPGTLAPGTLDPSTPGSRTVVDLELVLAVDVSRSMDPHEQALQRAGYVGAFRDPEVLRAIRSGPVGRIAVTYVEWAGTGLQHVVLPWTLVEDAASGDRVSRILETAPYDARRRTSISDALLFAATLFPISGYAGSRRVIDISGDGPNNQGAAVTLARDRVLDQGIIINGLPIMLNAGQPSGFFDVADLDLYYEDCVIGDFGAFIVTISDPSEFVSAIRRKLILEIAGVAPRLVPTQASRPLKPMDCTIGERLWEMWMQGLE